MVNHLLTTYAQNDGIDEAFSDIHLFIQDPSISATVCFQAFWGKALQFEQVYDEAELKRLLMKAFKLSVRHTMRAYWLTDKKTSMQALARNADCLCRLKVAMNYAEDVDLQMQPSRLEREKTRPVVAVQPNETTSSRKWLAFSLLNIDR